MSYQQDSLEHQFSNASDLRVSPSLSKNQIYVELRRKLTETSKRSLSESKSAAEMQDKILEKIKESIKRNKKFKLRH